MPDTEKSPADLKHETSETPAMATEGTTATQEPEAATQDTTAATETGDATVGNPTDAPKPSAAQDETTGEVEDAEMGGVDDDAKGEDNADTEMKRSAI
ncbi:SWI/SNF and RSC complex subunit Ssr2 [Exophiala oligosperma]